MKANQQLNQFWALLLKYIQKSIYYLDSRILGIISPFREITQLNLGRF
jgi:hypothetical protein